MRRPWITVDGRAITGSILSSLANLQVIVRKGNIGRGGGDRKQQRLESKDLRGMMRNSKSLKRNDEMSEGILIAPSKLPRLSRNTNPRVKSHQSPTSLVGFRPKFCGTDGKPTSIEGANAIRRARLRVFSNSIGIRNLKPYWLCSR
jgi:hypothetical protein